MRRARGSGFSLATPASREQDDAGRELGCELGWLCCAWGHGPEAKDGGDQAGETSGCGGEKGGQDRGRLGSGLGLERGLGGQQKNWWAWGAVRTGEQGLRGKQQGVRTEAGSQERETPNPTHTVRGSYSVCPWPRDGQVPSTGRKLVSGSLWAQIIPDQTTPRAFRCPWHRPR